MKYYILSGLIGLGLGAYLARTYAPRTETKTEIKEVVRSHVVTVEKETTKPDGSKVVERVVTDTSKVDREKRVELVLAPIEPQWRLSGGVGTDNALNTFYVVGVERRVAGPVWVGGSYATNGTVMATVGIEF